MKIQEKEALEVMRAAEKFALDTIFTRYEDKPIPDRLHYHATLHTKEVTKRAIALARAMGLGWYEIALVGVAAAFHDHKQDWKIEHNGKSDQRILFVEENEFWSAEAARSFLANFRVGQEPESISVVTHAILGTVPKWDDAHKTVIQPKLGRFSHPVTRALALADLGAAGLDSDGFLRDGISLFAERNVDIMTTLASADSLHAIDNETQEWHLDRFIQWMKKQPEFAQGRKTLFSSEIEGLHRNAHIAMTKTFKRFDESIERSMVAALEAQQLTYEQMAQKLLPSAFKQALAA